MDDMTPFERLVAGRVQHHAGPIRPVNDAAIFTAITATQSPRWRFQTMFSTTRFVVAGAIVVLFGSFLLGGMLTQPGADRSPVVGASASAATEAEPTDTATTEPEPTAHPGGIVNPEAHLLPGVDYFGTFVGFSVPTPGWVFDGSRSLYKLPMIVSSQGWERPIARIILDAGTPDGMYADPCGRKKGEPLTREVREIGGRFDLRSQRAELAAAVAAIPGVELVDGPSDVNVGGFDATTVAISVPDDGCVFWLWYRWDEGVREADPGDTIRVWIVDYPRFGLRFWIEAEAARDAGPELDAEMQAIVESFGYPG